MLKIDDLAGVVFAGLSALVIEGVEDEDDLIRVMARTRDEPVPCPVCGALTGRVHGYVSRTVTDVPVDGRRVVVSVQVRRLVCPEWGCPRQTFREQVPGLIERYQRRTSRLTGQLGAVVKELAGRAGARLSAVLAVTISRSTALRLLVRLPLPPLRIPRVLGVDDFALKRRHRYAIILIDAETGERIDVLPGRGADVLETWLRSHPGVEIVCRDGSGAYGEAVRRALPDAVQVGDRWHLWANFCDKTLAEVRSHSACWATVNPSRPAGVHEQTTRERWQQIHDLLDKGVGLLECARRLNLSLNTVKRYARTHKPEALRRAPRYRPTLVDPYRDHLRERRAADPAVAVQQLFREIKELGYTGSLNLLYRYITQGRAEGERPVITPRRLARLLLTHPDRLRDSDTQLVQELTAACPELAELARHVRSFAELLTPADGNDAKLTAWITTLRAADLPHLHGFANGIELDRDAVNAALTLPHHNGRTEGVNTRTKRIEAVVCLVNQCTGRSPMDELKASGKPFDISKQEVWDAWIKVKGNQGAPGVDKVSIEEFEADLRNNLYKIWNRMSSGSYIPPPVRAVEIPKAHGAAGTRVLGVPTVADRVAQTVVAAHLERRVEPIFHPDSFGYRPRRSALDAVATCRRRCWEYNWVIDLDIRKFFDSVRWDLVLKTVAAHTDARWVLLYVKRWLAAPMQLPDGTLQERDRGTAQGSAVSSVLAHLFMHYAFDLWVEREFAPTVAFERYADDAVIHCSTERQARRVLAALHERMNQVGLELHPDKTKIVYCQDSKRRSSFEQVSFTFLGYTFQPRAAVGKNGKHFTSFLPAVSKDALKKMSATVRSWRLHRRVNGTAAGLARMINPMVRGWMAYYGAFYRHALYPLLHRINTYLLRWIMNKYKRLSNWRKATRAMRDAVTRQPRYFAHWAWAKPAVR